MMAILNSSGLLERIAYLMMSKFANNFLALLLAILVVGSILNLLTSGSANGIMGALCVGLCMTMGIMKTRAGAAIAFAAMVGSVSSHAYMYMAMNYAMMAVQSPDIFGKIVVTPISVFLHNWPLLLASVVMIIIAAKWYKPEKEFSSKEYFREKYLAMGKMSYQEKCSLVLIVAIVVYLCTIPYHHLDSAYAFAIFPYLLFFIGGADPKCMKEVQFDMVFFVGSCMAIGTVASSLGLGKVVAELFLGMIAGSTSPIVIFGSVFAIIFFLNFLMTPTAIGALFAAPLAEISVALGMGALPFMYCLVSCSEVILLPYEYVAYLVIYAFGMMHMKDFIKLHAMRLVVFLVFYLFLLVPYWGLIGIL